MSEEILDNLDGEVYDDLQTRQKNTPMLPLAIRYGLIMGLVGVVINLVVYLTDNIGNKTVGYIVSGVSIAISVALIAMAIRHHRDQELGGEITFGRGVGLGTLASLVSGVVTAIWTFFLYKFIAPDLQDKLLEGMMEAWEDSGMSEAEIETALEMSAAFTGPGATAIYAVIGSLIFGVILSLIISAIMKRP